MIPNVKAVADECLIRGVSYEVIGDARGDAILQEISNPEVNQDAVKLEKAPRIAVYSPKGKQPWDDAVTLVLKYAEIPYDVVYDEEVFLEKLRDYDWLHLHHEDFTGQYGKFYGSFMNAAWYQADVRANEEMARKLGFSKVSLMKLHTAKKIREFVFSGGFLFAMCSATDSYDIALAAESKRGLRFTENLIKNSDKEHLAANAGKVVLHTELLTKVWGPEYRDDLQYLRVWISRVRRKLGAAPGEPGPIKTFQGIGYVLDTEGNLSDPNAPAPASEQREPAAEAATEPATA